MTAGRPAQSLVSNAQGLAPFLGGYSPPNTEVYFALQDSKVASTFEELAESQKSMWQSLILKLNSLSLHFLVQSVSQVSYKYCTHLKKQNKNKNWNL